MQSKNASKVHYAVITEEKNLLSCSKWLYSLPVPKSDIREINSKSLTSVR